MKHMRSLFLAILCVTACGGSSKEPAAPATEASAASNADGQADAPAAAANNDAATATPALEPEATCEKDADCSIFADCCSCRAVGAKAPSPVPCESVCGESKCEVKGKTIDNVACVAGVCKLK